MKIKQALKLHSGDEVFWNDPDNGLCSRQYCISEIKHLGGKAFSILDKDGSHLECFCNELS